MNSNKKTAIIVGVLFITALVSSFPSGVSGSIDVPDYLTAVSANENRVLIGVLFQLTLTASVVTIPIVMFPILREHHNERLALGYVVARIFEGFFDAVMAISLLLLLTLSREFVEAGAPDDSNFQTSGALLKAAYDWSSVPENFPYGLGTLILNYALYRSKLIPRWLSGWGLVGGTLILAMGLLRMFGHSVIFLAIPIVLNEMVLAVWLIVKGFNSSAIASEFVKTDIN